MEAWNIRKTLSLDEFALLMAGIDPSEVGSVNAAKQFNWIGWQKADEWLRFIDECVRDGEFLEAECWRVIYDDCGETYEADSEEVGRYTQICTSGTRVYRHAICRLFISLKLELPGFLRDHRPKTANPLANPFDLTDETQTCSNTGTTNIPPHLQEIQRLLDGTHRCQAPELQLALQAWLDVSKEADQDGELPSSGTKKAPGTEIERWLQKEKGYSKENEGQSKLVPRIVTVANWNKKK